MLPLGSLEQHGPQAPLGTDFMVGNTLPQYLKREMDKIDPDFPMLVMPTLPLELSMEHLDFAGSLSLQPETYYHVLKDTITSLNRYGFKKFALLICHGGNRPAVAILARQLRYELGVLIFFWHFSLQIQLIQLFWCNYTWSISQWFRSLGILREGNNFTNIVFLS